MYKYIFMCIIEQINLIFNLEKNIELLVLVYNFYEIINFLLLV